MRFSPMAQGKQEGDFVTLTTYPYPHDAELVALKARLDQADLRYYVMDDNFLSVVPFDTQAIGGVKVRVWEPQLGQALQIWELLKEERPQVIQPIDPEDEAWMIERAKAEAQRGAKAKSTFLAMGIGSGISILGYILYRLVM
ncbi:MAG: hypothetical protein AAF804_21045 [Bacteroidota bacterium]